MKVIFVALALVGAIAIGCNGQMISLKSEVAALPACTTATVNVTQGDGQWGCYGVAAPYSLTTLQFTADKTRTYKFTNTGYGTIEINQGGSITKFGSCDSACPVYTLTAGRTVLIFYNAGQYAGSGFGFTVTTVEVTTPYTLMSGQTYTLEKQQEGGFVYFSLPFYNTKGALFSLEVNVFSYQGLKEPTAYVGINTVPTLERYELTNTTVHTGGREQAIINKSNPVDGLYFIGVFLYGSTARISVTAQWMFNVARLTSGVRVQAKTSSVDYYQLYVPVNAKSIKFQISREVPGGYPIAYITQGTLPSKTNYQWIADTNVQSYISITINDPNPSNNTQVNNPGNYLIAVSAASASGYIMQCDW